MPGRLSGVFQPIQDWPKRRAGVQIKDRTEDNVLEHVEATLHPFDPADEGLIFTIGAGEITLGHAQFLPPPDQSLDDLDVGFGEQRFPWLRHGHGLFQGVFS